MPTFNAHLPRRRTVFQVISISVAVILALILGLTLYVYKQSVGKFEIRRLSLPTRVYADMTPLRAGLVLSRDDLLEKLDRLGYRSAPAIGSSWSATMAGGSKKDESGAFDFYSTWCGLLHWHRNARKPAT